MGLSASSKQQQAAKARVLTKSAGGNGHCVLSGSTACGDKHASLARRAARVALQMGGFEGAEEGGGAQGYVAQRAAVSCSEP